MCTNNKKFAKLLIWYSCSNVIFPYTCRVLLVDGVEMFPKEKVYPQVQNESVEVTKVG